MPARCRTYTHSLSKPSSILARTHCSRQRNLFVHQTYLVFSLYFLCPFIGGFIQQLSIECLLSACTPVSTGDPVEQGRTQVICLSCPGWLSLSLMSSVGIPRSSVLDCSRDNVACPPNQFIVLLDAQHGCSPSHPTPTPTSRVVCLCPPYGCRWK